MEKENLSLRLRDLSFKANNPSILEEYKKVELILESHAKNNTHCSFTFKEVLHQSIIGKLRKEGLQVYTKNGTTIVSWK